MVNNSMLTFYILLRNSIKGTNEKGKTKQEKEKNKNKHADTLGRLWNNTFIVQNANFPSCPYDANCMHPYIVNVNIFTTITLVKFCTALLNV